MASNPAPSSIDAKEAAHFGAMAADWWDPKGKSAMLHRLNPARLSFIRASVDRHCGTDARALRPLAGKRGLDVGCGAGLVTEPLARLGATMTGVDAAPENIAVARAHAESQGLSIDYRAGAVEAMDLKGFDLVVSLEVVEHVTDPKAFVAALADTMAPGGLLILSTPNRTALSRLAMITLGEGLGQIPKGTHDWDKFIRPDELVAILKAIGLNVIERRGLSFDPLRGFHISQDETLNYLITARLEA